MKEKIKELIRAELGKPSKRYYFIAGLPRSGGSLLSTLLHQNPKIYAGPDSPVLRTIVAIEQAMSRDDLFLTYPKSQSIKEIISSTLVKFYLDVDRPIIFDKNKQWTSHLSYIKGYFDIENPKIICPVRSISDILISYLTLIHDNPITSEGRLNFIDDTLVKTGRSLTIENRCSFIFSDAGLLGQAYTSLKQAMLEGMDRHLLFVEYDSLINDTQTTLNKIYEFIEEEPFAHNLSKIENTFKTYADSVYALPGLDVVRPQISKRPNRLTLPSNIEEECSALNFWRDQEEPQLIG